MQGGKKQDLDKMQLLEGRISVDSIPGLCQALGYFPSGTLSMQQPDWVVSSQEHQYKYVKQTFHQYAVVWFCHKQHHHIHM